MRGKQIPDAKWDKFLAGLSESANVTRSAKAAGMSRVSVYARKKADEAFAKQFDQAYELGTSALQDEVVRRGYEGTLKPVFQSGKKVGVIREYSDSLLMFELKRRLPDEYRDRVSAELTGKGGAPLVIELVRFTDPAPK